MIKKPPVRILCIDSDEPYRRIVAKFFTLSCGHMVYGAENGINGIKKAAELTPDVIFMEARMPDITGVEVLAALNAEKITRDIPVVMITGENLTTGEYASIKLSRNLLLLERKPVDFHILLRKINSALGTENAAG